jgi:hypothetical protein
LKIIWAFYFKLKFFTMCIYRISIILITLLSVVKPAFSQSLTWTPDNGDGVSFFQEANWIDESTGLEPESGTLDNGVTINRDIDILNSASVCGGTSGVGGDILVGEGNFQLTNSTVLMNESKACGMSFNTGMDFKLDGGICYTNHISGANVELVNDSEIEFYGSVPLSDGANINIISDSWSISFNALSKEEFLAAYLELITINGNEAVEDENIAVWYNGSGTVVTPASYVMDTPLTLYSGTNLTGDEQSLICGLYDGTLSDFDDQTRSFKLNAGYMVTFAQDTLGDGVSKVYIASEDALEINLPDELQNTVSFVRVSPWFGATKKGICAKSYDVVDTMNVTWFYDWGNSDESLDSREYVPMNWSGGSFSASSSLGQTMNYNHHLAFNEPDNDDQANMTTDKAIEKYKYLLASGLRLGSPAVTDGANGKAWRDTFMTKAIDEDLRVDFMAVHYYKRTTASKFYTWLKDIYDSYGLPIWVTEFNYGGTWLDDITMDEATVGLESYVSMLDTAQFVERYAVFTWQPPSTLSLMEVRSPIELSTSGIYYRDHEAPTAYTQEEYDQIADTETGIFSEEEQSLKLTIYPNPVTNGVLYVELNDEYSLKELKITIYDMTGTAFLYQNNGKLNVDVSGLSNGFYIMKISTGDGQAIQKIFITN